MHKISFILSVDDLLNPLDIRHNLSVTTIESDQLTIFTYNDVEKRMGWFRWALLTRMNGLIKTLNVRFPL